MAAHDVILSELQKRFGEECIDCAVRAQVT
jgi:hypothetical protein